MDRAEGGVVSLPPARQGGLRAKDSRGAREREVAVGGWVRAVLQTRVCGKFRRRQGRQRLRREGHRQRVRHLRRNDDVHVIDAVVSRMVVVLLRDRAVFAQLELFPVRHGALDLNHD